MKTKRIPAAVSLFLLLLAWSVGFLAAQTDLSESREISATRRQPPDKVMDAIGVKPGMVVGEIGAGRGRYTVYLARRVGESGKILANDINKRSLDYLRDRCRRLGFGNVETILGEMEDPLFPEDSLDMAIMVWVYHHLDKPDPLLENLRPSLKPGATLVIIDPPDHEIDGEFGIDRNDPNNTVPTIRKRIERSAEASGYELVRVETFLPKDLIFILKPLGVGPQ
jgi:ubiquinone/menaquinone biosynthesis C-methylase UbiE